MKTISTVITIVLIASIAVAAFRLYAPKNNTGEATVSSTSSNDAFNGRIVNVNLPPQKLEGMTATDEGCGDAGNGLVNCFSDIATSQGTLRFEYKHNMNIQPCLDMNGHENVIVNILDSNGNAEVIRTQSPSGMVMSH